MRIARWIAPKVVYHVISRFVARGWIVRDLEERLKYLHYLGMALGQSDWLCIAYAIMSNHIHLAMVAGEQPMWKWLKRVHSPFANWINQRNDRLGSVFADRPKVWAIRPENVASLVAYIHNNPVRAGVVRAANESRWTSHAAFTGTDDPPRWLAVEEGLRLCNVTRAAFDARVATEHGSHRDVPLEGIHREARKRGAIELGTPTRDPIEVPLVARAFARIRPDPREVVAIVSDIARI